MGSVAASATRHCRTFNGVWDEPGQIDLRIVLGLAIGGIPSVLVAALLVKEMPLEILRWPVFVVVVYTSAVMFRASVLNRRHEKAGEAASPVPAS